MATQINWNMPELRPPGQEIASISGLLGSIADAREKKREFEMEQARLRAQDEQQARHQAALEAYNQQALAQQDLHQRQTLAQARQLAEAQTREKMQEQANPHMDEVRHLVDTGDIAGAQARGGQYGVGVTKNQGLIDSRATAARTTRGDQFNTGLEALQGIGMFPGLPEGMTKDVAQASVGNTDEEVNPSRPPVQFRMPAGSVLDYDPVEAKKASRAEVGRLQAQLMESQRQNMQDSPHWTQATKEIANNMATEGYHGDPVKEIAERNKDLEHGDLQKEIAQTRRQPADTGGFDKVREQANARALTGLQVRTNKFVINSGLNKLGMAKVETDNAKAAMSAAIEEGNPLGAAHALEKLTGLGRMGMATTPALQLSIDHLNGLLGKGANWVAKAIDGGFGEEAQQNIMGLVDTIQSSINEHIEARHQAFVASEYTGANKNLKGNVEDKEAEIFGPLMPPGWQPDYDPEALQIVPGSGMPPSPTGRGKPRARPAGAPAGGGGGGATMTNQQRMPVGSDDMRVVPSGGLPPAAQAAGTGSRGVPGADPAMLQELRAVAQQLREQRQQRRQQGGTR